MLSSVAASALVGFTGFVGSHLRSQANFTHLFNSQNIGEIAGKFDTIVCAGAPGTKWLANKNPEQDQESIERLSKSLTNVECDRFVLISTVDVFGRPLQVDEDSSPDEGLATPYGHHRRILELKVRDTFPDCLVVRLSGLVGSGLRKNALFDMHHGLNLSAINPASEFQFYPVGELYNDIQISLARKLHTVHLSSEPISVGEINQTIFHRAIGKATDEGAAKYDLRTKYARFFGAEGSYRLSKQEALGEIAKFHIDEPSLR